MLHSPGCSPFQLWLRELRKHAGDTLSALMLLENKIDLCPPAGGAGAETFTDPHAVRDFCESNGLMHARVTAKFNHSADRPPAAWGGVTVLEAVQELVWSIHNRRASAEDLQRIRGHRILKPVATPCLSSEMDGGAGGANSKEKEEDPRAGTISLGGAPRPAVRKCC